VEGYGDDDKDTKEDELYEKTANNNFGTTFQGF
jgi:hypothetical protein